MWKLAGHQVVLLLQTMMTSTECLPTALRRLSLVRVLVSKVHYVCPFCDIKSIAQPHVIDGETDLTFTLC